MAHLKPRRALLVEDHEDSRLIFRTVLEDAGWEVLEAADGEAGLRLANERSPTLVVMDISVPRLDGWQLSERLKADPATRDVPILLVTAHALDADRARARELGCEGYLAKPIPPDRFLAEVERLTGES